MKTSNYLKGFSFFCGTGGSSIGYKKAGLDVIGGCDVDNKQLEIYKIFQKPKIANNVSIVDYLYNDYDYLYNLDFIDGSPPCTNFSTINTKRSDKQFKEVKYNEGGITQKIEELTLIYLQVIKKYQPKIFVLENVVNLIKQYKPVLDYYLFVSRIEEDYKLYKFILNPYDLGAKTKRPRLFIVGVHKSKAPKLPCNFSFVPKETNIENTFFKAWTNNTLADIWDTLEWDSLTEGQFKIWQKLQNKEKHFESKLVNQNSSLGVITTKQFYYHYKEPLILSAKSLAKIQGFDYDFSKHNIAKSRIMYAVGMSVHPLCTEYLGNKIKDILTNEN